MEELQEEGKDRKAFEELQEVEKYKDFGARWLGTYIPARDEKGRRRIGRNDNQTIIQERRCWEAERPTSCCCLNYKVWFLCSPRQSPLLPENSADTQFSLGRPWSFCQLCMCMSMESGSHEHSAIGYSQIQICGEIKGSSFGS